MAKFTTRVELHAANADDYENLHKAMKAEGFLRTIKSDDGKIYELPTAEYNKTGNYTTQQVIDSAEKAAKTTKKSYGVIVSEATNRKWNGLKQVTNEY